MMSQEELLNNGTRTAESKTDQPAEEVELSAIREQLIQAQARAAEYLDSWRRATAELSNARKRMQREAEEYRATAAMRVLEKLLPVADDMNRAFGNVPADQADSDWVNGFRMIGRKLDQCLEGEGVALIPTDGQLFDPALHYAISHEETTGFSEGQIIAEVAKGYRLGEKVLRPSMVRVAKSA